MCTEILGRSCVYPWVVEKPALVPNAFKWVSGSPHLYLAVKLELRHTYRQTYIMVQVHTVGLQGRHSVGSLLQGVMPMILQMQQHLLG